MNLNELPIGAKAKVTTLTATDSMRRRLLDIGLINGTVVECLGRSLKVIRQLILYVEQ